MGASSICLVVRVARWCVSGCRWRRRKRMPEAKITVLLVDDHSLVRRGFRRMLEDEPDIAVVGEASDGEEAIKLAREWKPRVVIMDCALPKVNGLEATRQILEDLPETAVLMLSM